MFTIQITSVLNNHRCTRGIQIHKSGGICIFHICNDIILPCIDLQIAGILHIQQCRPHIDIHITNNVQRNIIFCRIDRDTLCIGSAQFIHIAMRYYKCIINSLPALQAVGFRLFLRTRAIFLFFRPRLRRKRAHRQG